MVLALDAATLPSGWERRAKKVQNSNTRGFVGLCVEAHDLAASKLVAFRDKDRAFVRQLLAERLINERRLVRVLNLLPLPREERDRLIGWVDGTARELAS